MCPIVRTYGSTEACPEAFILSVDCKGSGKRAENNNG